MGDRSHRDKERLNYEVLHNSGRRVRKVSDSEIDTLASTFETINMAASINKFRSDKKKIAKDINECLDMNDLTEMLDVEMIEEYIEELISVHRKF